MKKHCLSLAISSLVLLVSYGCGGNRVPANSMVFPDNVSYVKDFPKSVVLGEGEIVDPPGYIMDSITLVKRSSDSIGIFHGYTYPGMEYIGRFGNVGRGPGELDKGKSLSVRSQVTVVKEGVTHYIVVPDGKGNILKFDVESSLRQCRSDYRIIQDSLPPMMFAYMYIDDSTYMQGAMVGNEVDRFFIRNGSVINSDAINALNERVVIYEKDGMNHNLTGAFRAYSQSHGRVIEAPYYLNAINIYSLDGSYAKSVCIGSKVDDMEKVQMLDHFMYVISFEDVMLYDDFFAVLYLGDTELSVETTRDKTPQVMLFDYDGNPIAKLEIPYHARWFDPFCIDEANKLLFVDNADDKTTRKYDLSGIF